MRTPNYKEGPFRQMTLEVDPCGGSDRTAARQAGALYRHPVCRHPGIRRHRHQVSQEFSAVYAGQQTVDEALAKAQALTTEEMEAAGY